MSITLSPFLSGANTVPATQLVSYSPQNPKTTSFTYSMWAHIHPYYAHGQAGLYVEIGTAYALGYTIEAAEARLSLGIGDRERT